MLTAIVLKHGWKTAHFHLKMDHCVAPRHGTCFLNTDLHSFDSSIAMEEQRPSLQTPT